MFTSKCALWLLVAAVTVAPQRASESAEITNEGSVVPLTEAEARYLELEARLHATEARLAEYDGAFKNKEWHSNTDGRILEYATNADPPMSEIPVRVFPPELHETGPSRVIPFDLQEELQLDYPATTPNLLANFVRVSVGESLPTAVAAATSQAFYVIRGTGSSLTRNGTVSWSTGDLFVLPFLGDALAPVTGCSGGQCVQHQCVVEPLHGGCALYWVHDGPLLHYLGVRPSAADGEPRFAPSFFDGEEVRKVVGGLDGFDADGTPKNRRGVLFGNPATEQTKTLTPSLWSLLNVIAPNDKQGAHKHNSVALDLAVDDGSSGDEVVWTSMGAELDSDGAIINPQKIAWRSGGVFITPPGWWHSHHNVGDRDAWVLPIQDAGLYTHQRTLDIRFADDEAARLRDGRNRGATIKAPAAPSRAPHATMTGDNSVVIGSIGLGVGI